MTQDMTWLTRALTEDAASRGKAVCINCGKGLPEAYLSLKSSVDELLCSSCNGMDDLLSHKCSQCGTMTRGKACHSCGNNFHKGGKGGGGGGSGRAIPSTLGRGESQEQFISRGQSTRPGEPDGRASPLNVGRMSESELRSRVGKYGDVEGLSKSELLDHAKNLRTNELYLAATEPGGPGLAGSPRGNSRGASRSKR